MDAKSSLSSWWILAMISLFLWYRNDKYDRALSVFIFTLGLIQLINYGICSGSDPLQSGQALFITLWLQCLVLAIGVFIFIKGSVPEDTISTRESIVTIISGWNVFLFSIIFVVMLILSFTWNLSAGIQSNGSVEWKSTSDNSTSSLLGKWTWLYLLGIFVPLFLIFTYYSWSDVGIAILILYGALSAGYILAEYPIDSFINTWCYFSIGFAFIAWLSGLFQNTSPSISSISSQ